MKHEHDGELFNVSAVKVEGRFVHDTTACAACLADVIIDYLNDPSFIHEYYLAPRVTRR